MRDKRVMRSGEREKERWRVHVYCIFSSRIWSLLLHTLSTAIDPDETQSLEEEDDVAVDVLLVRYEV
jgi:hypothetical protein